MSTETEYPLIYTIGHSTRTQAQLVELLERYRVGALIDIRRIAYSRHNPQFNREEMMRVMPEWGIRYEHIEALGGVRPPQEVIDRAKSCSERSRGFASYMETEVFKEGLRRVLGMCRDEQIALMCAESDPTHCHRFWVADAIVAEGVTVRHITSLRDARLHPQNLFSL